MNRIAAVVVTYNRKALLRQCLTKLLGQTGASCDVILIDNASTDGTDQMIRTEFSRPEIIYENTGSNLGGAGGFEYGVGKAVRMGYEYVWIMDDDTLPEENTLAELFEADKKLHGNWGFLSSVAYWTDGSICRMNIQKKDIFRHVGKKEYAMETAPIKMCSFVSLLVKSSVIREVGLPIGEYFIWTDDYEYTGRISRRYPCYMVPKSRTVHAMKVHTRVNFAADDPSRIDRYRYIYRNDVHCYRQYGIAGWAYILSKDVYTVLNILKNADGDRLKRIRVVGKGFREGLHFHPKIKRKEESVMDKQTARVSILVPVYKTKREYLNACVESLTGQTYRNIEIILVDDGSPDECGALCDSYGAKDCRIQVLHQENQGLSGARNSGMALASGEYIMFVDSDDWLERDCVEKVLSEMERQQTDVLCFQRCIEGDHPSFSRRTGSRKITEAGLKEIQLRILMYEKNYGGFEQCAVWGKLYKRSVIEENHVRFPIDVRMTQDVVFHLYLFEYLHSVYYWDYVGYHYRMGGEAVTRRLNPQIVPIVLKGMEACETFVRQRHGGDSQYAAALGLGAINRIAVIESVYSFNRQSPPGRAEALRVSEAYLRNERIQAYLSCCSLSDCRSFKTAMRYLLETRKNLFFYYAGAKIMRRLVGK